MAAVLLDTTVLIDLLRGRNGARSRLEDLRANGDEAWISAVNAEEIARGLRDAEHERTSRLLGGFRMAPIRLEEGWRAGNWRRDFAERGVTLAQADCLIAAAAFGVRARLATGNPKHFPMEQLQVDHWPVGE